MFSASCRPPSGTATAGLTDQNGDKNVTVPASFTVSGCPSTLGGTGGSPGAAGPQVTKLSASGLGSGHASLTFEVAVAKRAAKLAALTIELPDGMSFVGHRSGRRTTVRGVTVTGAAIRSLTLSHGHLLITLRKPVQSLTVRISAAALRETAAFKARAKAKNLHGVVLTVIATNTKSKRATMRVQIKNLGL